MIIFINIFSIYCLNAEEDKWITLKCIPSGIFGSFYSITEKADGHIRFVSSEKVIQSVKFDVHKIFINDFEKDEEIIYNVTSSIMCADKNGYSYYNFECDNGYVFIVTAIDHKSQLFSIIKDSKIISASVLVDESYSMRLRIRNDSGLTDIDKIVVNANKLFNFNVPDSTYNPEADISPNK